MHEGQVACRECEQFADTRALVEGMDESPAVTLAGSRDAIVSELEALYAKHTATCENSSPSEDLMARLLP